MGHPHIDEVLTYEKSKGLKDLSNLYRFCRTKLSPKKFDLLIDLHGTNRSFLTRCFLPEVQALSMDKRRIERFLLVKLKFKFKSHWKLNLMKSQPRLHERNIKDFAWAFNRVYKKQDLLNFLERDFPGNRSLTTSAVALNRKTLEQKTVVLAPGASFASKRWPVERFSLLAKRILGETQLSVQVVAGPDDKFCEVFNDLEKLYPERFRNMQGKLSLKDSMELVSGASLVIGNDSLIGHIAESCSVPAFSIFGPTSESFGFSPHLKESKSFSVDGLWCRPCSTTGSKKCFRKEQYCMLGISPDEVFDSVCELFKSESHDK